MLDKAKQFQERAIILAQKSGDMKLAQIALNNLLNAQKAEKAKTMIIEGEEFLCETESDRVISQRRRPSSTYHHPDRAECLANSERVFISYSRLDKKIVEPFVEHLAEKGIPAYFDAKDRPADDAHSLMAGLSEGLAQCYALLVFLSQHYLESAWCRAELRGFLHHSIRERKSPDPPILIVDLDQAFSANSLARFCFGSRPPQKEEFGAEDDGIPGTGKRIQKEAEEVLKKSSLSAEQLVERIRRIPADKPEREAQVDRVIQQLAAMKTNNAERPTFSDPGDFNLIWDQAFKNQDPQKAGTTKERIVEALASSIPAGAGVPEFESPQDLWNYVWKIYKHKTVATDIDIVKMMSGHRMPDKFEGELRQAMEKHSEPGLLAILNGIADRTREVRMFDRPFFESTPFYDDWSRRIEFGEKQLDPGNLKGHPLHLLIGEAQRRKLIVPLQYSYYRYLDRKPQNSRLYAAVVAGLLINVDMWFEVLDDEDAFMKTIIHPLSTGRDIRSMFP
jgi:hypothetical protein